MHKQQQKTDQRKQWHCAQWDAAPTSIHNIAYSAWCSTKQTPEIYFKEVSKWMKKINTCPEMQIILEKSLTRWMTHNHHIEIWELEDTPYQEALEHRIQAQNFVGWSIMLKGRIASDWGDIQMTYYEEYYDEVPTHISATWWASKLIQQLLYFSLAAWQHQNNYLQNKIEQERKVQECVKAPVESMAHWYEREHEFTADDKPNFSRSFLERCTDTTALICLWLGKIIDIHKFCLSNYGNK